MNYDVFYTISVKVPLIYMPPLYRVIKVSREHGVGGSRVLEQARGLRKVPVAAGLDCNVLSGLVTRRHAQQA